MLPDIKQRIKQASLTRESSHMPLAQPNNNSLLERHLEMQKVFLTRAEQNDARIAGALTLLANAVSEIGTGIRTIHSQSMESYNNICSLLHKVVKLQSSTNKAEKTVVSELQELNKGHKGNPTVEESVIIGRGKDYNEEARTPNMKLSRQVYIQIDKESPKLEPVIDILDSGEITQKNAEDELLGTAVRSVPIKVEEEKDFQQPQQPVPNVDKVIGGEQPNPLAAHLMTAPPQMSIKDQAGEFRDKQLLIALGHPIQGKGLAGGQPFEEIKCYLRRWIGQCADVLTKEAFSGYYEKRMLESETKVFLCNNILLNFHNMIGYLAHLYPESLRDRASELIAHFQSETTKALDYYLSKYPQKKKVFIGSDMQNLLQQVNELDKPENSIIGRLGCSFPDDGSRDFNKSIKVFLNALVKESQAHLPTFKERMKEIFTVRDSSDQPYLVEHLIGMKFRENTPTYSDSEINKAGMDIKSPEVLRVLIKWTEQLEQIVNNPKKKISERTENYLNRNGQPIDPGKMFKDYLARQVENLRYSEGEQQFIEQILNSTYCDLPAYVKLHRDQFDYLPLRTVQSGMTVHVLSEVSSRVAVLYLNKLMTDLNQALKRAHLNNVYESRHNFKLEDMEFIPFTVCDLLRAKCSGKLSQIREVIKNLSSSTIKIVRVKNRLDSSNRDFLINFFLNNECRVLCQLQIGLKDASDDKQNFLDHFNHFLYELCRSKYGVLSESVSIISNLTEVGSYFARKISPLQIKNPLSLKLKLSSREGITLEGYQRQQNNFSFLCSNCMELRKAYESEQSPWRKNKSLVCSYCVYAGLDKKDRALFIMGEFGLFYEEVDKLTKTDNYICLVEQNRSTPTDFYSNRHLQQYFDHDAYSAYYMTFGSYDFFYNRSFTEGKRVFRLRENTLLVTLKLDMVLDKDSAASKQVINLKKAAVYPEQLEKIPEPDRPFSLGYVFSDSLKTEPERLGVVRCAVHPEYPVLLPVDFQSQQNSKDVLMRRKLRFHQQKQLQNMIKTKNTRWILANQDFDEQSFKEVRENNHLEWLYLDRGKFSRIDFFRSTSLTKLHIPVSTIVDIGLDGNYPNLTELDLMKNKIKVLAGLNSCTKLKKLQVGMNQIEVLDFTVLDLPCLELLDVNTNKISRLVVDQQPAVRLPSLTRLIIGKDFSDCNKLQMFELGGTILPQLSNLQLADNNLKSFKVASANLPSLSELNISSNKELTNLDLSECANIKMLKASNCSLSTIRLSATNVSLEELTLNKNKFSKFDMAVLDAPTLKKLDLSHNQIRQFKVDGDWSQLQQLHLSYNRMEELQFIMESKSAKFIAPGEDCALNWLDLGFLLGNVGSNCLRKLDLRPLGKMTWLKQLSLEFNMLGELLFDVDQESFYVFKLKLAYNPNPHSNRAFTLLNFVTLKEFSRGYNTSSLEYCWWKLNQMTPKELEALSDKIEKQRINDSSIPEKLLEQAIGKEKFLSDRYYQVRTQPTVVKLIEVYSRICGQSHNDYENNAIAKRDKTQPDRDFIVLPALS